MKLKKTVIVTAVILAVCLWGYRAARDTGNDGNGQAQCIEAPGICDELPGCANNEEVDDCAAACSDQEQSSLEEIRCEHQVPIIDCDNCRFEVGVVKIAAPVSENLIETGVVEDMERAKKLKLTGQVQIDRTKSVDVVPTGSGSVRQVTKFLGEGVKKGDVLAVIHSADLGQSKAEFLDVQAKLELANSIFDREKEFIDRFL